MPLSSPLPTRSSSARTLAVLHPVFALTGVLHAVGGALLPSLAARFHLSDSTSGLLFLLYFAGTSLGALLCRGSYARLITIGFAAMVCTCFAVAACPRPLLAPAFLLLGISVGVPMSAVTLFVGRALSCTLRAAASRFSTSVGASAPSRPRLSPRACSCTTLPGGVHPLCLRFCRRRSRLRARSERQPRTRATSAEHAHQHRALSHRAVFAFAAFLQVGIENTVAAWLPTYALRMAGAGLVLAAASTSFYWAGFLCSRGLSSLLLLRVEPMRVFRIAVALRIRRQPCFWCSRLPSPVRNIAMFLLGASLAPTYPLVLAGFFARSRHTADSRWILFTAGFGGSVLPWIAGFTSTHTGSLRTGMLTIPAALALNGLSFSPSPSRTEHESHITAVLRTKREGKPSRLPFGHTIDLRTEN